MMRGTIFVYYRMVFRRNNYTCFSSNDTIGEQKMAKTFFGTALL